jgi:hypothetical protein
MTNSTTVTINKSTVVHWGSWAGTSCGAGVKKWGSVKVINEVQANGATCKRCIKIMAQEVAEVHEEALAEQQQRLNAADLASADVRVDSEWVRTEDGQVVRVTRTVATPFPRVSFSQADGTTGTLPLSWFLDAYGRAQSAPEVVDEPMAPASELYVASIWESDKGVRYLFLGSELVNGESMFWLANPVGGQQRVTLVELVQRFVAVRSAQETEEDVAWNQTWRSRYFAASSEWYELRVIETLPSRVVVRSMVSGRPMTMPSNLFVQMYRWMPEPGADNYGRQL